MVETSSPPAPEPEPAPAPPVVPRTTIRGSAWLKRKSGDSEVIRGLRILVLRPSVDRPTLRHCLEEQAARIKRDVEFNKDLASRYNTPLEEADAAIDKVKLSEVDRKLANLPDSMDLAELLEFLCRVDPLKIPSGFGPALDAELVTEAHTSVDGKFELPNVPGGHYYLHASESAQRYFVEWLIPVDAKGEVINVDFENANAAAIYNIGDR